MKSEIVEEIDVAIIGAGFAGLYALHKFRDDLGLSAKVFESGGGVGGTWFWNRYPGARCDTESFVYCYSFSRDLYRDWEWSGKYPTQPELLAYLKHVADRFDLLRSIELRTTVVSAHFIDDAERWLITTNDGREYSAKFFVTGLGLLASARHMPEVEGLDDFSGEWVHTGAWPEEDVDLAGKRVAVIGTGSTGVQLIPEVARQAATVTVFQRTPQFTIPAQHHTVTVETLAEAREQYDEIWDAARSSVGGFPWQHNGKSAHDDSPEERQRTFEALWNEGGFKFVFGSYRDLLTDRRANDYASEFVRRKIRARVADEDIVESLMPRDHPFGTKRPIVDTNYFEVFDKPNVDLVDLRDDPIVRITSTGILTESGERSVDLIIFATGFDAVTGPFFKIDIRGRDGRRLADEWADGPVSYLGLAVAGFPNMFTITGPGSTFGNAPVIIEHHVEWIAQILRFMHSGDFSCVEAGEEPQDGWMALMERSAQRTLMPLANSWFTGANIPGKVQGTYFFLGSYGKYRETLDGIAANGFYGFGFTTNASRSLGLVEAVDAQ